MDLKSSHKKVSKSSYPVFTWVLFGISMVVFVCATYEMKIVKSQIDDLKTIIVRLTDDVKSMKPPNKAPEEKTNEVPPLGINLPSIDLKSLKKSSTKPI